jgi:hypothetical protein
VRAENGFVTIRNLFGEEKSARCSSRSVAHQEPWP